MITTEEVRDFIEQVKKDRDNWLFIAKKSWQEIKKRTAQGTIYRKTSKRPRYPAWYSIFKIRQSLVLARIGEPICKDTTQDGNDNIGATAAMAVERLAKNLPKNFSFFDVLCAARDDFLVTNFGWARAYFECKEIKQNVKEYVQFEETPDGLGQFRLASGELVDADEIYQDDEGYFIERSQVIDVEDERVYLKPVLYCHAFIEPGIHLWDDCKRIAYELHYSPRDFKEIFGTDAYSDVGSTYQREGKEWDKCKDLVVYEYWDKYEKECKWLAEYGSDFISPKNYRAPDEYEEGEQLNGLYDLEALFPSPPPLVMNASTDEFWPIPEFYQMEEIIDDIHTLFGRMMAMTRALRPRFLYDAGIPELKPIINEASDLDGHAVPNLSSLIGENGGLDKMIWYVPLGPVMEAINNSYAALDQRLQTLFQRTGTSDLLQGLTQSNSDKTLGERQMEEKYALNQMEEPQRKMQEFVADCYRLLVEMALKNFKDETLDRYIMPQTMPADHQPRYRAAIGMAKQDLKRFRIDLATDSTLAINEEYDKRVGIEFVNALTAALEKTANIATVNPALVIPELHCLKFLIQKFRQGKMFQSEITSAIDNVIKQAEAQPIPFNKDEATAKIKAQEMQANYQLRIAEIQSREKIDIAKINQDYALATFGNQLEQLKLQMAQGKSNAELQLAYQQLNAEIAKAQQELTIKHDALLVELRKVADKKELDQFEKMLEMQVEPQRQQLEAYKLQIDQAELQLRQQDQMLKAQENAAEDYRIQVDNVLQKMRLDLDAQSLAHEMRKPPELPPITIQMPQPATTKKRIKIRRDELGNIETLDAQDVQEAAD